MTDAELNEAVKIAWALSCDAERRGCHPDIQSGALEHLEALREAQRQRAQDHGVSALEVQLKESRGAEAELFTQLEKAKEVAARADAKAEELHAVTQEFADLANERLMKIRKQEQTIQTQGNTIAKRDESISRMNVEIRGMDHQLSKLRREKDAEIAALRIEVEDREDRINDQYKLIQTLRGTRDEIRRKLLERIRKDLLAVYPPDGYVPVSDVDEAIGHYLKEVEEGIDP